MMALRDTIYVKHVPDHSPRYATRRVWASTGMDHMMNEIHLAFRSFDTVCFPSAVNVAAHKWDGPWCIYSHDNSYRPQDKDDPYYTILLGITRIICINEHTCMFYVDLLTLHTHTHTHTHTRVCVCVCFMMIFLLLSITRRGNFSAKKTDSRGIHSPTVGKERMDYMLQASPREDYWGLLLMQKELQRT